MKPESLEGLLIDQALGELTLEVEELLDAHLAADPVAAQQAAAWAQTWQVARRAAALESDAQLHPPPLAQSRRIDPWSWKAYRAELLRLAACLVIGVATGWALFATQPARPEAPSDAKRPTTFWSMTHLAAEYPGPSAPNIRPVRYELRWKPPVRIQQEEETYETSIH